MKETIRKIILFFLLGVLLFSGWQLTKIWMEYHKGRQIYAEAQLIAGKTEKAEAVGEEQIDFARLQEKNPEIFGWIEIADTPISYPLLQGTDHTYYLTHTYDRQPSGYGSIFLDVSNQKELTDRHAILYGHNMKNKEMFGILPQYRDAAFAKEHDTIRILLPERELTYRVFSAYRAYVLDEVYTLDFPNDAAFQKMLEEMCAASEIPVEQQPTTEERILTLSTCTPKGEVNYRFVVNAVLVEEKERS